MIQIATLDDVAEATQSTDPSALIFFDGNPPLPPGKVTIGRCYFCG